METWMNYLQLCIA